MVDGVSFSVEPGEIFGILGPNGAGKTTTVECIGGLRQRDGGNVTVAGLDPADEGAALPRGAGDPAAGVPATRQDDGQRGARSVRQLLPEPARIRPSYSNDSVCVEQQKTYFAKLSGGQKQRLSVALALIGNPRVAILDELTTGLDPAARRDVWELLEDLRGTGVTLLLVSHFMEEAEKLCDRVIVIDHGRIIAADTPEGLAASVQADQRMSFLPSAPFDLAVLQALPDVHSAARADERVVVTGTDNVASAVIIELHGRGISVGKLRVDQPSLDDAFVALTTAHEQPSASTSAVSSVSAPASTKATSHSATARRSTGARPARCCAARRSCCCATPASWSGRPSCRWPPRSSSDRFRRCANHPSSLDGLSFFQIYQPILVFFAITLLAMQALPDVLTRYREMGVLKRLRTTPVSPALLLFAQLTLILAVAIVCMALMVVIPPIGGAPWPRNVVALRHLLPARCLGDAGPGDGDREPVPQRESRRRLRVVPVLRHAVLRRAVGAAAQHADLAARHLRLHPERRRRSGADRLQRRPLAPRAVPDRSGRVGRGDLAPSDPLLQLGIAA